MANKELEETIQVGIVGTIDFTRRLAAIFGKDKTVSAVHTAAPAEAWAMVLEHRPSLILVEIGLHHNERIQHWLKTFLFQLRERYNNENYITVCLTAPETLAYGGDLLFANDDTLTPSLLVDTFIVAPPASVPTVPSLAEQAMDVLEHCTHEIKRRQSGKVPLPPLGSEGWVQSLADLNSRDLWMRWLPRYASYTNENPIIIGATGTGKTNLAYALHLLSGRPGKFISITPRDFSSSELVQAELFGAVAGAYTGAVDKWGLVKSAEKGTLFIDELQSIDKELQGKLITFIENKVYRRVGSAQTIEADVRFVFASNRTLYDMMESDVLRHDFAYRLERVQLELADLSSRRLDISAALGYALAKVRRQRPNAKPAVGFNSQAYRMLFSHTWPGNLRQLENTVAQLCEISDMLGISLIDERAINHVFRSKLSGKAATTSEVIAKAAYRISALALSRSIHTVDEGLEKFIEVLRGEALEASGGEVSRAAELIGEDEELLSALAEAIISKKEADLVS